MKILLTTLIVIFITSVFAEDIWEDDFEELTGWMLNGEFQIDSPQGLGGEYGNPDPTSAYSGSNVLGVDLTGLGASLGDYETDLSTHEYFAISPVIDCSQFVSVELNFIRWLNVEVSTYDHAYICVSNDDGTTWNEIWTNSAEVTDNSWNSSNYDISEIADLNGNIRIRFSIGSTDGSWQYSGWNVDDVVITGSQVAYGAIDGNITDSSNNEPIAFAPIMSQYGNTMSDEEGYFILNDIPVGNREIVITALGYLPFTESDILVTENDTIYVSCELMPDPNTPPSPQNPQAEVYDGNNVHLSWEEPELPTEELLAYNVYRNGIILESILEIEYFDVDVINGFYSYYISAVYDSGESLPTDTVNVHINISGIENDVIPQNAFSLSNYPNPFNPETTIYFELKTGNIENAEIRIYNLKGQRIRNYSVITPQSSITWNGTDQSGKYVSSGIYFYQLVIDGKSSAKNKMMLLK